MTERLTQTEKQEVLSNSKSLRHVFFIQSLTTHSYSAWHISRNQIYWLKEYDTYLKEIKKKTNPFFPPHLEIIWIWNVKKTWNDLSPGTRAAFHSLWFNKWVWLWIFWVSRLCNELLIFPVITIKRAWTRTGTSRSASWLSDKRRSCLENVPVTQLCEIHQHLSPR